MNPIFLISLPRSGSTFLQKILMSHPDIASTAEPWFLLPLCYMRKKGNVIARYGHPQAVNAFLRITNECGENFVDAQIANFANSIYAKYCINNEKYFLDKTPRYYFILDELIRLFPCAKFIVLLRNPISIFASSIEAFRGNTMRRLDHLDSDFFQGPERIGRFLEDRWANVHVVTYEQLVSEPQVNLRKICDFLELDYMDEIIENSFKVQLKGHGDKIGANKWTKVLNMSDKWRLTIDTKYRKKRLLNYLKKYSKTYLKAGGYDRKVLMESVNGHKPIAIRYKEYFYAIEEKLARTYKIPLRSYYG